MSQGRFITLEGGEGAGKSTLAQTLAANLRARGHDVVVTREPGGAPGADQIRMLLVEGGADRWSALEETLLFTAARLNHLNHAIRPALARGAFVICDRYIDSTRAYQVAGGGVSVETLKALSKLIDAPTPDLTLILDLDQSIGLQRSRGEHIGEDRFERKDAAFHARVRAAFHDIASAEPQRCVLIDASLGREAVATAALRAIEAKL